MAWIITKVLILGAFCAITVMVITNVSTLQTTPQIPKQFISTNTNLQAHPKAPTIL
ncbi:hypothetical protein BJ085DRAFT_34817 [Dimargaris cristalligena]|uniref:Uncharacterized protein n=1 Tax=Dimargaris cristalligena TaxID=215637 RepID=A0A4P9ZJ09_9FUNG|nr:hypothetical protein BJ085DRAFT_34817 [Dimargaris cristalligena]|eukprot:RKP33194.1 hypothetical protein BJ085DRAFT_34817 [Dimargaris cristalligena]